MNDFLMALTENTTAVADAAAVDPNAVPAAGIGEMIDQ